MKVYAHCPEGELPVITPAQIHGETRPHIVVYLKAKDAAGYLFEPEVKAFELKEVA